VRWYIIFSLFFSLSLNFLDISAKEKGGKDGKLCCKFCDILYMWLYSGDYYLRNLGLVYLGSFFEKISNFLEIVFTLSSFSFFI